VIFTASIQTMMPLVEFVQAANCYLVTYSSHSSE